MGMFVAGLILMLAGIGVIFSLLFKQNEYSDDFAFGLIFIWTLMTFVGVLLMANS